MSTLRQGFAGICILMMSAHSFADSRFYRMFPSCKVFLEVNCNTAYETVGYRMTCYRSFLDRKQKCLNDTKKLFVEWEKNNKEYEAKKRAEVKQKVVNKLDANYSSYNHTQIETQDLQVIDKIEGSDILRDMLSFINRVLVPATKLASESYDSLLEEAKKLTILRSQGDNSFSEKLTLFREKHKQLTLKVNVITHNYQANFDLYRPKILGLRFEENVKNFQETLEATKFLIINAFEMEKALPAMLLQLEEASVSDNINKLKVKTATKREIILQKLYWARKKFETTNAAEDQKDLEFILKLCSFEFPEDNSICNQIGVKE